MRTNYAEGRRMRFYVENARRPLLAAVYPGLYCPRCGSTNIGMKMLSGENVIWDCRECLADFRLDFPKEKRF